MPPSAGGAALRRTAPHPLVAPSGHTTGQRQRRSRVAAKGMAIVHPRQARVRTAKAPTATAASANRYGCRVAMGRNSASATLTIAPAIAVTGLGPMRALRAIHNSDDSGRSLGGRPALVEVAGEPGLAGAAKLSAPNKAIRSCRRVRISRSFAASAFSAGVDHDLWVGELVDGVKSALVMADLSGT